MDSYRSVSLWWDELGNDIVPTSPLPGDLEVDVAIVGGGFSGLWTARSLLNKDPSLRVAILEKEVCGFGASGRNGGWASALFAASDAKLARLHGIDAALSMRRAMNDAVFEIERACKEDGIDCHFQRGGTIMLARSTAQIAHCHEELEEARALGISEEDFHWLDANEAEKRLNATGILGGTYNPHCAVIQPALLARGLKDSVVKRGGMVFEKTPATELVPGGNGHRGAPYHFGSAIKPSFDRDADVFEKIRSTLVELFPSLSETMITHQWGGPLGIPRDWYSSVGLDRSTGLAWAGGYVGDGVTTTNLAGRTLADLITNSETALTSLPWVDHRSPTWEIEPLRWIGVNAGLAAAGLSDRSELRRGKPSWLASKMERLLGG